MLDMMYCGPRHALKNGRCGTCYPDAAHCESIVAAQQWPHVLTTDDWVSTYCAMLKFWGCGGWNKLGGKAQLDTPSWQHYKGTWFYNGQQALVVERWLNRVEEDTLGPTCE